MDRSQRLLFRLRAAGLVGGLLFLGAAAPHHPLLILDPAVFADDRCVAPAVDRTGCLASEGPAGPERGLPSASAALILPPRTPAQFLKAEPSRVIDFGPELALPAERQRLSLSSAPAAGCSPATRHRPDRINCARTTGRKRR